MSDGFCVRMAAFWRHCGINFDVYAAFCPSTVPAHYGGRGKTAYILFHRQRCVRMGAMQGDRQSHFFEWLSKSVSSAKLSELYHAFTDLEERFVFRPLPARSIPIFGADDRCKRRRQTVRCAARKQAVYAFVQVWLQTVLAAPICPLLQGESNRAGGRPSTAGGRLGRRAGRPPGGRKAFLIRITAQQMTGYWLRKLTKPVRRSANWRIRSVTQHAPK